MALALVAALMLSACGSGGSAGQELSNEPVTLRFTWWGSDERHKRTQQVMDLFQKKHPNITVKGEFKEWNGYWESLATTVAANDAPDVIQMDELYLSSYAERGALLDLGTMAKFLKTADFDKAALDTGLVNGKQYALPTGLTTYSIVANTDLLDQYGIDLPDDATWSWDDLKRIGGEVSEAGGGKVTGVQSLGFEAGGLNIWVRQHGAALFDEQGDVAAPPEVLASFWTYVKDLAAQGVTPPAAVSVERAGGSLDQSGTATNASVFATWWNTQLSSLTAASGSKLRLLKLPGEAQAKSRGAYYKPSMYWSVSSRSEHPAEAALFVDFLANDPEAANIMLTDRGIPANTKVRESITPKLTEDDKQAVAYMDGVEVGPAPRVTPNGASTVEAIIKRHTEEVLFDRETPEQAAAAFIKELQAEIDGA
ncbi:ABC transporter substrate-binding protein [Nonomuraea aridisoli]|uniref:ABC transporter substrate-binding protein n=1 Tax=Nonomuraea aridisoli TaxID=2070368 RepID=A0A2W2EU63_9ACTN|nr:ABC transporter substrate-binding protein [Nonomuraea aridisoli]